MVSTRGALSQPSGRVVPAGAPSGHSSLKFTTSSRDLGSPHTLLASVLPLHPPSLRLMVLKKRGTKRCLSWMSQWLRTFAHQPQSAGRQRPPTHPSHARPLQRSLDAPTLQLDRRPQCSTRWRSSRSIRPNSTLLWTSLSLIL